MALSIFIKKKLFYLIVLLLSAYFVVSHAAFSQTDKTSLANNVQDDIRASNTPFAEERAAGRDFIAHVNEARRELALKQADLARQKIIMASSMLPIIARVTPLQSRLTRVEFGGGFYADDLSERKIYFPVETQSLENLTRGAGPRWIKNTKTESDAKITYFTMNMVDGKAQDYLNRAQKALTTGHLKEAEDQLAELSDAVIKIDDNVPAVIRARDYITLTENYMGANNFFGARLSLEKAHDFLEQMKKEDIYRTHQPDIIELSRNIKDLQTAFTKLDADQIKKAKENLEGWRRQLSLWAGE